MQTDQDVLLFFGRHFVSLRFVEVSGERGTANSGKGTPHVISGFIASVSGLWFFVTAGHILEAIEQGQKHNQVFRKFTLDDGWAMPGKFPPIPFPYDAAFKWWVNDDDGTDCGFIALSPLIKLNLEAAGIVPLDERSWKHALPAKFNFCTLVGIPTQFNSSEAVDTGILIISSLVLFRVSLLDSAPDHLVSSSHRYYAKLVSPMLSDGTALESVDGMSGGPLIGFKLMDDGSLRYWILGIQSAEERSGGYVIASPFLPLALTLEKHFIDFRDIVEGDE